MVLDEPSQKDDQIEQTNGIQISVDSLLAGLINDALIDVQKFLWMEHLILRSAIGSKC